MNDDQKCEGCRFWELHMTHDDGRKLGQCRIRSTPNMFPYRYATEWCGEHQSVKKEPKSKGPIQCV